MLEVGGWQGALYVEGVFMAEGNLLEDERTANERQKLDWAGLIFHVFFFRWLYCELQRAASSGFEDYFTTGKLKYMNNGKTLARGLHNFVFCLTLITLTWRIG